MAYENKRLEVRESESRSLLKTNPTLTVETLLAETDKYDLVSFDIFDTLIFRAVDTPIDAFYLMGEALGIQNFRALRTGAEYDARMKCRKEYGHTEITLSDIWNELVKKQGSLCTPEEGMKLELETELKLCYANPFMLKVWKELLKRNKEIIIVSDMYLPSDALRQILLQAGYESLPDIIVSCEHGVSKADGKLFNLVKAQYLGHRILHVGDNPHSDVKMAKKAGLSVYHYPNINEKTMLYRPFDMSCLIGSAYRGLVNAHIYNGLGGYSMEYEYGFIYGGLFVLGYCHFIHDYYVKNSLDKLLFLSRDGDILKQVYDILYPEDRTEYVYWSRKAATKLMADLDRNDFFRRFIYHKVNQGYTLAQIFESMELGDLLCGELSGRVSEEACGKHGRLRKGDLLTEEKADTFRDVHEDMMPSRQLLTDKNADTVRDFLEDHWEEVKDRYSGQQQAARAYYARVLKDCSRVAAVDIGWAGSGALSLDILVNRVWGLSCPVTGIIAGTNTVHNAEPDATESFRQSGKLVSYLYSPAENRDLWKKHDPGKDYNVFWELLLGSTQPSFNGFKLTAEGEVSYDFGKQDANIEGIKEVQQGIKDFVRLYHERWSPYPYMEDISGRDAYAPMLLAASYNEKYLKEMEKKFNLEVNLV